MSARPALAVYSAVRVTGGPLNGLEGSIAKLCATQASILVLFEGVAHELVVELRHLEPLDRWLARQSRTELALRGYPPP